VRTRFVPLFPRYLLHCILLLAGAASSQMHQPPLGRLEITSTPPGASITINNQSRPERTNVSLVVSPGNYTVSITGGPGNLNCQPQAVSVQGGKTVRVTCPPK
jgi:hypothetical protein